MDEWYVVVCFGSLSRTVTRCSPSISPNQTDKWRSTLHRVVKPPPPTNNDSVGNRRMSIAFFVNMNGDAHVEPIESCGEAKYAPITAGQHLLSKHLASMGEEL